MNPTYVNPNKAWQEGALAAPTTGSTPAISASLLTNPPEPMKIPAYEPPVMAPFQPSFATQQLGSSVDRNLSDIGQTVSAMGQEPQRRSELESQVGIPQINSRLAELQAIDAQYGADLSNLASQQLQQTVKAEDRLAPTFAIGGQQAQINRQAIFQQQNTNIKRATNAAVMAAANGQLALAQDYVTRALDYEFKPLEAKLQFQQLVYQENKDRFTKAEQREFEANLKAKEQDLANKQQEKQSIYELAQTLIKQGYSPSSLGGVLGAKSLNDAYLSVADTLYYGGDAVGASVSQSAVDWANLIRSGQASIENVPADERSAVATALGRLPQEMDSKQRYINDQANVAVTNIDKALDLVTGATSGAVNTAGNPLARSIFTYLPGSDARNLQAALSPVKALIGFDALQKMRDASPTGGALGQVSERELSFLQSVQGSLDVGQSTEQLLGTMNQIRDSFRKLQLISNPSTTPEQYLQEFPDAPDDVLKELIMRQTTSAVPSQTVATGTRAQRNNNPLNIKASQYTRSYPGVVGIEDKPADDGGNFLRFDSPDSGFAAAERLLQTSGYQSLTVDAAMKRWSNSGYGGEIVPFTNKKMSALSNDELRTLVQAMAKREGYYA